MPKRPRHKFKPTKQKRPRFGATPTNQKRPAIDYRDSEHLMPAWQVSRLEMCAPYGWHELDSNMLLEIRGKLASFESMTWHEILGKRNHEIGTHKLCRAAQKRLRDLKLEDVESLVSLRLGSRYRVWGIKQHNILILLWWDPNHEVCPAPKRHT